MQKSVLLIGMGDLTGPVLEKAHNRGLRVIATNRNPQAKTLKQADVPLVIDGTDIESLLAFVLTDPRAGNIVDVYAGTELFLSVNILKLALGIPANSIQGAFAGQHKVVMLDAWRKAGVPVPRGATLRGLDEAYRFVDRTGFPVILKPADGHSAIGVRVVWRVEDLADGFKHAVSVSTTNMVVMEEYIKGSLHDVNGIFIEGKFYPAGVSDKSAGLPPACIVEVVECPTRLTRSQQERVYELLENGSRALGISAGPVKCDIIWGQDGPRLLEVAPRFHGELGSLYLLPLAQGIDMYDSYFHYLSTGHIDEQMLTPKLKGHVVVRMINAKPGKIVHIDHLKEAQTIPGIEAVLMQKYIGDHVQPVASNYDIPGYVVARGQNREAAMTSLQEFESLFNIVTEKSHEATQNCR
jgi:biotin carboxylase